MGTERILVLAAALLFPAIAQISARTSAAAEQAVVTADPAYQGPWVTTNRKPQWHFKLPTETARASSLAGALLGYLGERAVGLHR